MGRRGIGMWNIHGKERNRHVEYTFVHGEEG